MHVCTPVQLSMGLLDQNSDLRALIRWRSYYTMRCKVTRRDVESAVMALDTLYASDMADLV